MIAIPDHVVLCSKTVELIEFFNQLEQDLTEVSPEDTDHSRRVWMQAEYDLIMWGKI